MTTNAEETAVENRAVARGDRVRVVSVQRPNWSGALTEGAEGTLTGGPSECCSGNHRWHVTLDDGSDGFASEVVKVTAPVIEDEDAAYLRGAGITEPEAPETAGLEQEITLLRERAERAERELEAFRDKVRTRVIEEADARGWCSEADDWLEELGLEGRSRDYIVYVRAIVSIPLAFGRTARDADAAAEQVEFSDVQSELDALLPSVEFSLEDYEIAEVNED